MTIICVLGMILIAHGDRYLIIVMSFRNNIHKSEKIINNKLAADLIHDSSIDEILFNER